MRQGKRSSMSKTGGAVVEVLGTGLFAVLFTGIVSGIWGGLLVGNLAVSPAAPWSVAAMALVLWLAFSFLGGRWGHAGSRARRRAWLRSTPLPGPVMALAILAGVLWIVSLAGFWIVLHRLVMVQSNPLPDFSKYPVLTVVAALAMASISGGVSEEAGFRGYFQGALERRGLGPAAILVVALVMAPEHALSQGFVWPNVLFYLLVDVMLGALAYLTQSIRPGIVVHTIGLFVFFTLVWPGDKGRLLISSHGPDAGFWLQLGQTAVFAALGVAAFIQLAKMTRRAAVAT